MSMAASNKALDFTNVKESSGINPKHVEDGDYLAKITDVRDEKAKDGTAMWLFLLQLDEMRSAVYPYYCKLEENQLWKVRNLLIAAGKTVPKKRVNVNPNNLVGTEVGITLTGEEYDGKMKSVIDAVFPASELAPATSSKSSKATTSDDVDDDLADEEDLDEMELEDL